MKKVLGIMFVVLLVGIMVSGIPTAEAKVSGACSGCHTMHNSQNGAPMVYNTDGTMTNTTPQGALVRGTCAACHTSPGVATITLKVDATSSLPAGGSFKAAGSADNTKHNVQGLGLTTSPGNANYGGTGSGIGIITGSLFTCAGANGCHGTHGTTDEMGSIKGGHHGAAGTGYRMLWTRLATGGLDTPVMGTGASDYEKGGATATNHNIYRAGTGTAGPSGQASISELCAGCHKLFHGTANTTDSGISPFKRHPTENAIPSSWDVNTTGNSVYSTHPLAFAFANGSVSTNNPYTNTTGSGGYVACVSCHRAHGTAEQSILRFTYSAQIAGGGGTTGCLGCHSKQRN